MLSQIFALFLLLIASGSADVLKNPDFESAPTGLPKTSAASGSVALSSKNNTIPGWTFEGSVMYVTSGDTISLPGNGHALQLGEEGKINQTFVATGELTDYLLTFTIALGGPDCVANADLLVSAPDSSGVYSFNKNYGKEAWQSYGHFLGAWDDGELVNLVIQSQTSEANSSSICWPVIDDLILKSMPKTVRSDENLLSNEGFEFGPEFLGNSSEGILIGPAPSPLQSPLLDWLILGTVRYIDSDHFLVPQGKAAVEIVSGASAGIQTAVQLVEGSSYRLEFKLGGANNSCVENFVVGAQAGLKFQNFTVASSGTGLASNFSMTFKAASSTNTISFISYTKGQTKDGILCGPVVDDVILKASSGTKTASSGTKTVAQRLFLVCLLLVSLLW